MKSQPMHESRKSKPTLLAKGNEALRNGDYAQAIGYYAQVFVQQPDLVKSVAVNLAIARKKYRGSRQSIVKPRVAVCGWDLAHNAAGRAYIDIVVPVFNALTDVKRCLESLEQHTDGFNVQILVVNDGSDKETTKWLQEYCNDKLIFTLIEHPGNLGYTRAVNSGLRASTAEYVITQNSDTIVPAGWLIGMVRCMTSDNKIGVVGPLSNAASWQNVPLLRDETGGFAVNALPEGHTVDTMAKLVASVSTRDYPRLPFVNGFCFMIRRAVIEKIGYMDEENFPIGYGEENDFCIRAIDAGYELAIVDDVYVYHAKSKSFGNTRRKELSEQGAASLRRKHSSEKYSALVQAVKNTEVLDALREKIQSSLKNYQFGFAVDFLSMRILFLLPVSGGGGGSHSVVQEVSEMRRLGLHAQIGVKQEQLDGFHKMYLDIPAASDMFVGFNDMNILAISGHYDAVIGTIFSSMSLVKRIVDIHPHILPAYYVQDYEPLFFPEGSIQRQEARDSFTQVKGALLFAKTQWIIEEVDRHHSIQVHKVKPSIDHEVYKPVPRTFDGRLHITAMIRPQTPYRGAERTMRLFARLHKYHGDGLAIHIFGCEDTHPDFQKLPRDFSFINHGLLRRPQVASLLARSDLFIDLSDYQAFGRTALEAMASGCAAVVPQEGGANEYAVHKENAIVVNTNDDDECFDAVSTLIANPKELRRLRRSSLVTAARYSVHAAAISEMIVLENAIQKHQANNSLYKLEKNKVYVLPNCDKKGTPFGSGYVRLVYPYQTKDCFREFDIKLLSNLPDIEHNGTIVVQRHLPMVELIKLESWLKDWKQAGGTLIYDIDDDMLDSGALLERGFGGDMQDLINRVLFLAKNADLVIVSNEELQRKMWAFNSKVMLIHNTLDKDLWALDNERNHHVGEYGRKSNLIRIGYIGTPTHDEDLRMIAPAIKEIERRYGNRVEIEVIGGFEKIPALFGKRVGLPKKSDYPNFIKWLLQRVHWDIGLVPLLTCSCWVEHECKNANRSGARCVNHGCLAQKTKVASDYSLGSRQSIW